MSRLKSTLLALFGIGVVLGLAAGLIWAIRAAFHYLSVIPKELAASLVAAGATILVATLTVVIGRYFERKRELDALHRDKKTQIYDEFLKEFFAIQFGSQDGIVGSEEKDLVPFLRDFMRKLVLWSGPNVIAAFVAWKDHLGKGVPDAKTIFLTEDFLKAIREDLRHSNRGLPRGFFASLLLRESELFLAMAKKNPNVTLADLAVMEALLEKSRTGGSDT